MQGHSVFVVCAGPCCRARGAHEPGSARAQSSTAMRPVPLAGRRPPALCQCCHRLQPTQCATHRPIKRHNSADTRERSGIASAHTFRLPLERYVCTLPAVLPASSHGLRMLTLGADCACRLCRSHALGSTTRSRNPGSRASALRHGGPCGLRSLCTARSWMRSRPTGTTTFRSAPTSPSMRRLPSCPPPTCAAASPKSPPRSPAACDRLPSPSALEAPPRTPAAAAACCPLRSCHATKSAALSLGALAACAQNDAAARTRAACLLIPQAALREQADTAVCICHLAGETAGAPLLGGLLARCCRQGLVSCSALVPDQTLRLQGRGSALNSAGTALCVTPSSLSPERDLGSKGFS